MITETKRLIIRRFELQDAEGLYALNAQPEVLRYTGDPPFDSVKAAKEFVKEYDQYERFGMGRYAVVLKESNGFIGWCGLKYHTDQDLVDLGFRLKKEYWNRGIATEAAEAVLKFGFEHLNLPKIVCRVMHANTASRRVAEKLGMSDPVEKEFDQHPGLEYELTQEAYERRRKLS